MNNVSERLIHCSRLLLICRIGRQIKNMFRPNSCTWSTRCTSGCSRRGRSRASPLLRSPMGSSWGLEQASGWLQTSGGACRNLVCPRCRRGHSISWRNAKGPLLGSDHLKQLPTSRTATDACQIDDAKNARARLCHRKRPTRALKLLTPTLNRTNPHAARYDPVIEASKTEPAELGILGSRVC